MFLVTETMSKIVVNRHVLDLSGANRALVSRFGQHMLIIEMSHEELRLLERHETYGARMIENVKFNINEWIVGQKSIELKSIIGARVLNSLNVQRFKFVLVTQRVEMNAASVS